MTKTIKTIVFAALFAAMILPFSGMQSVDAVHENEETHVADETHLPEGAETAGPNPPEIEIIPDGSQGPEVDVIRDGSRGPEVEVIPVTPEFRVNPDQTHGEDIEVIPDGTRISEGNLSGEIEVIPDGTRISEGDLSGEIEVIPDHSRMPEGSQNRGSPAYEGSNPDGSHGPPAPEVPVDQSESEQ